MDLRILPCGLIRAHTDWIFVARKSIEVCNYQFFSILIELAVKN